MREQRLKTKPKARRLADKSAVPDPARPRSGLPWWAALLLVVIFLAVLTLVLFRGFVFGGKVLLTTDAAITAQEYYRKPLFDVFAANWRDTLLVGEGHPISIQLTILLLKLLGTITWNNLMWPIAAALSSLALLLYFRSREVSWMAGLVAGLCGYWLGSNFTLLYPGHGQKFFVLLFFTLGIAFAQRVAQKGKWYDAGLFGVCSAAMFAHQADIALFCALFLGPYVLFRLLRRHGPDWRSVGIPLAVATVPALMIAASPLLQGYRQNVRDVSVVQDENPAQKWEYITQWSWPPEESIAFIAPGYTGWRSGDPEGPYWGRMGRSAGWEATGKGFQNFKLESTYLGMIPAALALFAVFISRHSRHRAEIRFWAIAAALAFVLACGKYLPAYALFYKLPAVNVIRNPNKFLQVFQVAVAILAGYGANALLKERASGQIGATSRAFCWIAAGVAGVMLLAFVAATVAHGEAIGRYTALRFPPDAARRIVTTKMHALLHAAVMAALASGAFAVVGFKRFASLGDRRAQWVGALLLLVITVDVGLLSRHYIQPMPRSYIEANVLTRTLEEVSDHQRVAMLTQSGLYNIWITYLFPFQGIPTFNVSAMPRLPGDYEDFFNAVGRMPFRMWQLCGVKYLIGPQAVIQSIPPQVARSIAAFDVGIGRGQELVVRSSSTGEHHIFEMVPPAPRYAMVAGSVAVSAEEALARLADPAFVPFDTVLLPVGVDAPELSGHGICGSVDVLDYRPGRVRLRVQTEQPAYLRIAERFDADWRAELNGEPVPMYPADFLFQAVHVPPGLHTIDLHYHPDRSLFYLQCTGILVGLAALTALLFASLRRHEAGAD